MDNQSEKKHSSEVEFIRYIIMGDPIPLARARHGSGRTWDSQKQVKLITGLNLAKQHGERKIHTTPLHLYVDFYMHIYKAYKKKNINNMPHIFKPDLDNLIKFVCDVANGILYADDSLIASITAKKIYDDIARTEFYLQEIK